MLKISNISKSFDTPVLTDITLSFPETGLFLIRGKSGIGKTTLLRLILGLEKPDSGEIEVNGITSPVFQEARLAPFLTLKENLFLVKQDRDEKKANALLTRFGLLESADKYPDELSGGQKQRGAIARSLYYGGDIFLWDEPTKELDPENRSLVIKAIHDLSQKALVIVVTHDPELDGGEEIVL